MALSFVGVLSANDAVTFATTGFSTFAYGTTAAVIYLTSTLVNGNTRNLVFTGTDQDTDVIDVLNVYDSTYLPGMWNAASGVDAKGPTGITQNTWSVVVLTKDTGPSRPVPTSSNMSSGAWSHGNSATSEADSTSTGQTVYAINGTQSTAFSGIDGHIAAVGSWLNRALSDSEVERLAAGSWNKYSPDVMVEWKSGRTPMGVGPLDHGRQRIRTTIFGSAITRSAIGDPPGFKFSPAGRRR
jgi:hypothetical protein